MLYKSILLHIIYTVLSTGFFSAGLCQDTTETIPSQPTKTQSIEAELLAPLSNNITLGYERLMGGWILEGRVGVISIGFEEIVKVTPSWGIFVKIGPKFPLPHNLPAPDDVQPLAGWYFSPQLVYSTYDIKRNIHVAGPLNSNKIYEYQEHAGALMASFGRQSIISDIISLEVYLQLGVNYSRLRTFEYSTLEVYHFSHTEFLIPLIALGGGLSIGILLP